MNKPPKTIVKKFNKTILLFAGLSFFVITLLHPINVNAELSKESNFIIDTLDSLYLCNWALDYMNTSTESTNFIELMQETISANKKFDEALYELEEYLNDEDEMIQAVSKGMSAGIMQIQEANQNIIEKVKDITNLNELGFENIQFEIAKANADRKEGWQNISLSFSYSIYSILETEKDGNIKEPVSFKIPDNERDFIIKKTNELFGKDIAVFENHRKAVSEGKPGNPESQTWIVIAVQSFRENLIFKD